MEEIMSINRRRPLYRTLRNLPLSEKQKALVQKALDRFSRRAHGAAIDANYNTLLAAMPMERVPLTFTILANAGADVLSTAIADTAIPRREVLQILAP